MLLLEEVLPQEEVAETQAVTQLCGVVFVRPARRHSGRQCAAVKQRGQLLT